MDKKWTQTELDKELELSRIAEKELNDAIQPFSVMDVMKNIENERKKLMKKNPRYTQRYFANMVGIGRTTYQYYINGDSDNISLKAIMNIVQALHIDFSDILKPTDTETNSFNFE